MSETAILTAMLKRAIMVLEEAFDTSESLSLDVIMVL